MPQLTYIPSINYTAETMQTKLTLRLEAALIRRAKAYASRAGKSVSGIVADYFTSLSAGAGTDGEPLPPRVQSLVGVLRRGKVTETDYRAHLEEKHR